MKKVIECIYVGSLDEYPERIKEFFVYDFKDRNDRVAVKDIVFADTHKTGEYLIVAYFSYRGDECSIEPLKEQVRKAFTNYKMELRISQLTGWRF